MENYRPIENLYRPIFEARKTRLAFVDVLQILTDSYLGRMNISNYFFITDKDARIKELNFIAIRELALYRDKIKREEYLNNLVFYLPLSTNFLTDNNEFNELKKEFKENKIKGSELIISFDGETLVDCIEMEAVERNLERLKRFGAKIAISGFGYDYNSLDVFAHYSFDFLRVDAAYFIGGEKRQKLLEFLIKFTDKTGVGLIVDNIETLSDYRHLKAAGIKYATGKALTLMSNQITRDFLRMPRLSPKEAERYLRKLEEEERLEELKIEKERIETARKLKELGENNIIVCGAPRYQKSFEEKISIESERMRRKGIITDAVIDDVIELLSRKLLDEETKSVIDKTANGDKAKEYSNDGIEALPADATEAFKETEHDFSEIMQSKDLPAHETDGIEPTGEKDETLDTTHENIENNEEITDLFATDKKASGESNSDSAIIETKEQNEIISISQAGEEEIFEPEEKAGSLNDSESAGDAEKENADNTADGKLTDKDNTLTISEEISGDEITLFEKEADEENAKAAKAESAAENANDEIDDNSLTKPLNNEENTKTKETLADPLNNAEDGETKEISDNLEDKNNELFSATINETEADTDVANADKQQNAMNESEREYEADAYYDDEFVPATLYEDEFVEAVLDYDDFVPAEIEEDKKSRKSKKKAKNEVHSIEAKEEKPKVSYDKEGRFVGEDGTVYNGYYDDEGHWIDYGYYDENGDWVENGYRDKKTGKWVPFGYFNEKGEWVDLINKK